MLKKGDKAPDFTLQNTEDDKVALSDYTGNQTVVLLFFPLAFTGTCTKELCTMRDNMKLYNSLNCKVLAISVDSFFVLKEFKKANNLNFTLLSDFNKEVSPKYDAYYEDFFGMEGVSKRAAFVIGENGTIQYAEVLDDASQLPDFKAIQKAIK